MIRSRQILNGGGPRVHNRLRECTPGIAVQFGYVALETEAFNSSFYSLGRQHKLLLRWWYSAGVIFGVIGMTAACLVLLWDAIQALRPAHISGSQLSGLQAPQQILTPVVPGINLPWSDFPYLVAGTAISMAVHEAGHALAAASEGVRIEYVAIFLAIIVPGAMVALPSGALESLPPVRALRIYCAGVWHNAAMCAICHGLILALPILLQPLYSTGQGLIVVQIPQSSPLRGHLLPGDVITGIDGIPILSKMDWTRTLGVLQRQTIKSHGPGSIEPSALANRSRLSLGRGFCVSKVVAASAQALGHSQNNSCQIPGEIEFEILSGGSNEPGPLSDHSRGSAVMEDAPAGRRFWNRNSKLERGPGGGRSVDAQGSLERGIRSFCLRARAALTMRKCGPGWYQDGYLAVHSGQMGRWSCREGEICAEPRLLPGQLLLKLHVDYHRAAGDHRCQEIPLPQQQASSHKSTMEGFDERDLASLTTPLPYRNQLEAVSLDSTKRRLADAGSIAGSLSPRKQLGQKTYVSSELSVELPLNNLKPATLSPFLIGSRSPAPSGTAPSFVQAPAKGCSQYIAFAGQVADLDSAFRLSDFAPRAMPLASRAPRWLQIFLAAPLSAPSWLEHLFAYTFHVSAALALLNLAPVFFLDGEAILTALLSLAFPQARLSVLHQSKTTILFAGSLLLIGGLLSSLVKLLL